MDHSFTYKLHQICLILRKRSPNGATTDCMTSDCSLLLIYRPGKDEKLSRPGWLTCSGRFIHISGHPLTVGRAQDRESSTIEDHCATQPTRQEIKKTFNTSFTKSVTTTLGYSVTLANFRRFVHKHFFLLFIFKYQYGASRDFSAPLRSNRRHIT